MSRGSQQAANREIGLKISDVLLAFPKTLKHRVVYLRVLFFESWKFKQLGALVRVCICRSNCSE